MNYDRRIDRIEQTLQEVRADTRRVTWWLDTLSELMWRLPLAAMLILMLIMIIKAPREPPSSPPPIAIQG